MSDQCRLCSARGNLRVCAQTECNHHETWYCGELKNALQTIFHIVLQHPAFDQDAYETRNIDALAEEGGDVCDWTMIAITAGDALGEEV